MKLKKEEYQSIQEVKILKKSINVGKCKTAERAKLNINSNILLPH